MVVLNASFLVWTTTPWTLVSNTAIAVHPDVDYVAVEVTVDETSEVLVVAEALLESVKGEKKILKKMLGKSLERTTYKRPFDFVEIADAHYVVLATYVTTEDGTGLVHQSPAFGADDYELSKKYDLPEKGFFQCNR